MCETKRPSAEEGGDEKTSSIPDFYNGRSVLVTGATGFMGKVLVEKLLRSCPGIKTVYLLMRPKRGNDVRARHDELLRSKMFDRLRNERPGFGSQLVAIRGDVTSENLGLSKEDRMLLEQKVSIIFHCAANVRFDQKLKNAIHFNTLGTQRVLQLAETVHKLDAFIHVSTAYCHCDQTILEEKLYAPPTDAKNILQMVEWMDDDIIDTITPKLIGEQPNTYAYSKNLTEQLVASYSGKFPVAIARPSIVTGTWKEPVPGWVENLHGPTGLLVGAGKGVIRSMHCKANYLADVMPCDIAINAIVILAWKVALARPMKPFICNVTESGNNPISWGMILDTGRKHLYDNPLSNAIWFPDGSIKSSWIVHTLCVIFFHFLPAYLIDFLVVVCGKKPFMVKIQRRIQGGLEVLQYYTTKEWVFHNANLKSLPGQLNEKDRETFFTDIKKVDWDSYIKNFVLGTRHYFLKEDPATLPQARKHMKRLYWVDRTFSFLFYCLLLWTLLSWSDQIIAISRSTFQALPRVFNLMPIIRIMPDAFGADSVPTS